MDGQQVGLSGPDLAGGVEATVFGTGAVIGRGSTTQPDEPDSLLRGLPCLSQNGRHGMGERGKCLGLSCGFFLHTPLPCCPSCVSLRLDTHFL
jgi:hypothetical protein